ncbi:hypothetical protein QYE76_011404 [Lolium multiflorum]|uniref:Uncharacterized protein n=1 Tax=Lolium multiflorum TaxID=4521 RepID=A0AAD8TZ22_LOLMU|nr:hypothetical protein QYE76_011404 [Lolium multiflorum]
MKQKRKIEEIPDCYHQSMGWGNLHYPLVENIAERADILSTGRLARGMIGMRHAIRGAHKVPFGLPSLLHCDPETWPDDRDNTGIHALLMPLDKPTVPAFIHTKEELDGHGPMHWVGCNGDWVAFVQQDGHLTIRNIYISDTIIPLPSLQDAGISLGPTSEWWHGSPPFLFKYKIDKSLELLKVRIVKRPYKDDLAGPWHYEVIVVFDELIAILQAPLEKEWNILRNPEFFDRNSYVDAMGIPGYGTHAAPRLIDAPVIEDEEAEVAAIFAQIEGDAVMEDDEANVAQGDGGADEDNDADEEELEEEELEEDEFDDEELDDEELDDDGDNHNYEDEDVFLGFSDQRTWFLAPMRAESITGESDLAWIQVKGYRPILGPPILHMGNKLRSYPLESHAGGLMCHFGREKTLLMLVTTFIVKDEAGHWIDIVNMGASKRADYVKKIHEKTKELIEKKGKSNAARMNKKRKEMLFKPGDLVWGDEFGVNNSFNVADLTPYDGEDLGASSSTPFEGGDDGDIPYYYLRHYQLKMKTVELKSNEVGIGPDDTAA